jgi:hypothetical protein
VAGRSRERDDVHLRGARPPQRASALVDGRARGVDVVHEREPERARARLEGTADVAAARRRVEPPLRPDAARAGEQRHDGDAPPARERRGELGGRVGAAQEEALAHGRHDDDRLDRRARHLVRHERRRELAGRDRPELPARHEHAQRALEPERRARRREEAQARAGAARRDWQGGRPAAARALRQRERAHLRAALVAHPLPRAAAGDAAAREGEPDERGDRGHAARLGPAAVTCQ